MTSYMPPDGVADSAPPSSEAIAVPTLRLVARGVARGKRQAIDAALRGGRLQEITRADLLAEEQLPALARQSLWLLLLSFAVLLAIDLTALRIQHAPALPSLLVVIAGNLLSYGVMLLLHEALHAAAILALGGRPRFGLKLPLAAYCTAPGQVFTRDGYCIVALAPLVVLTVSGTLLVATAPVVGACVLFGLAGNVAGAVGDLAAFDGMRHLAPDALIEDSETGYIAYRIAVL